MIIGLTGGSGTGKSTAASFFKDKGYIIIDCDKLAREVCRPGEECLGELREAFGSEIIDTDGSLKRQKLADIAFSDSRKLELLNSITHKYIVDRIYNIIEENRHKNMLIDAPLLFEADLDKLCSVTIGVLAHKDKRVERICQRDGISRDAALRRISGQQEDNYYRERCTYVVMNNGELSDLVSALKTLPTF